MSDRLTFNHGASALSPRLIGRHERGGRVRRSRDLAEGWPGPGTAVRADLSRVLARAERADLSYWGVFAFTALLLFRPQDSLPLLEPLHLPEIAALTALIAMVVRRAQRGLPPVPAVAVVAPLAAFAATMVLTAPFSIWPSGALSTFTELFLKVVLVFMLLAHSLSSPRLLRRFTWLIVVAMAYIAARGWFDYARGMNLLQGERLQGALPGLMGNPNDLAMNMVTFMPVAAVVAVSRQYSVSRRLVAAGIVVLMLATIVFTKSRGGVVGLTVMLVALIALGGKVRRGFGAMAVACILAAMPFMPASFWARMQSMFDEQKDKQQFTGSSEARRIVMLEGIATFVERPFTGVGAGQFKNYNPDERQEAWRESHNVVLQVAAELGIGGVILFGFLVVRGFSGPIQTRRLLRRFEADRGSKGNATGAPLDPRERDLFTTHAEVLSAALAGWFVCALFASVAYHWTFYYLLALAVVPRDYLRARLGEVGVQPRTAAGRTQATVGLPA